MHKEIKKIKQEIHKAEKDTGKLIKKDIIQDKKIATAEKINKNKKKK
jgi:hypothetical protein